MSVREATHAGSWYSSKNRELNQQLAGWLAKAGVASSDGEPFPVSRLRAIIAPHAGYSYSGPSAGYAYKCIQPELYKRVFILGPSHHVYLSGCAISKCVKYNTPLGDLFIDQQVNKKLEKLGSFGYMSLETDEDEHSIEMHLPYVYKVFEDYIDQITIVPILVGSLSETSEKQYGKLLAPFLADPENLFIISSDFCHWGKRFNYTYYEDQNGTVTQNLVGEQAATASLTQPAIFESIRKLDREGMDRIEEQNHSNFCKYLSRTKNTVCGRHPIGVLLAAIETCSLQENNREHNSDTDSGSSTSTATVTAATATKPFKTRFIFYAQSSKARSVSDSSVSYASAFVQQVV